MLILFESEVVMSITKGKWVVSAYEGGWDCVRDEQGNIICKLVLNNPDNASLIAAAPETKQQRDDLLKACKNYIKHLDSDESNLTMKLWLDSDGVPAMRQAIAQAPE